ncbi:MAG: sigma-70 family RNA polymerase sigma factor [Planctomycetales bacterium]|nr:sigma-70 family RNA polymerase sigma factor [Planctomycetales bacterium]
MITTATCLNHDQASLQRRTRHVLAAEIAFLPNRRFAELDREGAWKQEFDGAGLRTESHRRAPGLQGMPSHLRQMCLTPLLDYQQECDLFLRMNYLKYRANAVRATLSPQRPSRRKLEQIELLQDRALQIRNHLVCANLRLVISIVKQFADERNTFDDLLSEGVQCLIKAVEKYDFDRGFRFSTYATSAVRREIYRLIQRGYRDRQRFATGTQESLDQESGDEESSRADAMRLMEADRRLAGMIQRLDPREQFIVRARYGFEDVGAKPTFSRLGAELGVSKERVRQLEIRAMEKLRKYVEESNFRWDCE